MHEDVSSLITRRVIETGIPMDHLCPNPLVSPPRRGSEEEEMSFQSRHPLSDQHLLMSDGARPQLRQRFLFAVAVWRERSRARRCLARMDARSLREMGISPAAAAYESGKPFWQKIGPLR
jgi:uncharacterized protein YjiS (DUF1127 family)